MTLGTVAFNDPDGPQVALLDDDGWSVPGLTTLADTLNGEFSPGRYSPSDGDPVHRAVYQAAEFLGGTPTVILTQPGPPGRIY